MISTKSKPAKRASKEPKLAPASLRRDSVVCLENGLRRQLETQRALSKNQPRIQVGLVPHLGLMRQDSLEKLASFHNPFNGLAGFEKAKNQTQTFKMGGQEETTRGTQAQRATSSAKQRPPLTDRTNIMN